MLKRILVITFLLFSLLASAIFASVWLSLPQLEGDQTADVSNQATLSRDTLGTAIVVADNQIDAAYVLGVAHAQDRLFQMDLLRRAAAGELAELFGEAALTSDKKVRFHQFRIKALQAYQRLSTHHQAVIDAYTKGVNDTVSQYAVMPFEYLILGKTFAEWQVEDSFLVSFSMYIDLQGAQVERDLALTRVQHHFSSNIVSFILKPSGFQAALDGSIEKPIHDIPSISALEPLNWNTIDIEEPIDIGSNNWAVSGKLTDSAGGLLSDDMHLGLRVPPVWYRAAINYQKNGQPVQLNGVSLPGSPGIIVGTNHHIAWGFTNANLDNVDWIKLPDDYVTWTSEETIFVDEVSHTFIIEQSEFGPVRTVDTQRYALKWVAHTDYAVNLGIADLDTVKTVEEAFGVAVIMGIPVQNMVTADSEGSIGWFPAGALTSRSPQAQTAITAEQFSTNWFSQATDQPSVINPETQRVWTANARVLSTDDLPRFGNGGYALGARGQQIRDGLFSKDAFDEHDFYRLQLDNHAFFLSRWQSLLVQLLKTQGGDFQTDIEYLNSWGACACPNSVGYTLTRYFRTQVINTLLAPIENRLQNEGLTLSPVLRHVEPAIWQLVNEKPNSWLPESADNWEAFLIQQYITSKATLISKFANDNNEALNDLRWGNVNELKIQHPFSRIIPQLAWLLDMPAVAGFGDSYMPAVQNGNHGASQRLIIQLGNIEDAILTVPGGQSGHPLSEFYRKGFDDYVNNHHTPLLPGETRYQIRFNPKQIEQTSAVAINE